MGPENLVLWVIGSIVTLPLDSHLLTRGIDPRIRGVRVGYLDISIGSVLGDRFESDGG